jgi:hypothetical protein
MKDGDHSSGSGKVKSMVLGYQQFQGSLMDTLKASNRFLIVACMGCF